MKRPNRRIFSLVAFLALAGAAFAAGTLQSGCVFNTDGNPEGDICSAIAGYAQACGGATSGCKAAFVRDCEKVSGSLTETALNALFTCAQEEGDASTCAPIDKPLVSTCTQVNIVLQISPTAAQLQLDTDFCNACMHSNPSVCNARFSATEDGGPGDLTFLNLPVDSVVQTIDSTCTPHLPSDAGTIACTQAFTACAVPIVNGAIYWPPECQGDASAIGPTP